MQIQSGKLYENKTWEYLYPCLKVYGSTLKTYLNSFFKLAVGLGDHNIDINEDNCIYILIDTNIHSPQQSLQTYREYLSKFLDWVRFQPYYVTDYIFEGFDRGEKHMLVLRLPDTYKESYIKFKQGKYSEMYSSKDIDNLYSLIVNSNKNIEIKVNNNITNIKNILTKNSSHLELFRKQINDEFGTNLSLNDLKNHELDLPPSQNEEIFNYKKQLVT